MFYLRFQKLSVARPGNSGLVFEFSIQNKASRRAQVHSSTYELWLLKDGNRSQAEFLDWLSVDLFPGSIQNEGTYEPQARGSLHLVWHYSSEQLQRVEESRQGKEPVFEIRNQVGVTAQCVNADGSPHGGPQFSWESASDDLTNAYPVKITVNHDTWIQLLDKIGFRSIILRELSVPTFPPGFGRPQEHLSEAWKHHRAGREDEALASCHKAFECLGFNLYGDDEIKKAELLERILSKHEPRAKEEIKKLWRALQDFFHLGRHEKGAPVKLSYADGELAVVCATALLNYLARRG